MKRYAAIKEWLTGTIEGRALLRAEVEKYVPREPVLLIFKQDGLFGRRWLDCYANHNVRFHEEVRPRTARNCENLADEYVDKRVPRWCRGVNYPIYLRHTANIDIHPTAMQLVKNIEEARSLITAVRDLNQLGMELRAAASREKHVPSNGPK